MSSRLIIEEFQNEKVTSEQMEMLLAAGWRHFGEKFYRYNISIYENRVCSVMPLRISMKDFQFSKSQRKILAKNKEFSVEIKDLEVDAEKVALFERHKRKFKENIPQSIYDFLSYKSPAYCPLLTKEVSVYDGRKLIACSFMDETVNTCSSIYGMFDLDYGKYSLGLLTMLLELEFAIANGKEYYYHGYCYNIPSFYDYKKKFNSLYYYDWHGQWLPFPKQ
ncbi:arginine-tRNA-protein transferase [Limibacter armeniacum]|uniref:arginine-tRNA-protein transferase n=1 Tax=Limibacter armeniacum TaxID=466084 RepID=UPI002FE640A8